MAYSRETEGMLVRFCVEQRNHFDAVAWGREYPWEEDYTQIACYLLSGLGAVPKSFSKTFATKGFQELVEKNHFDCARFFNLMERQPEGGLV